MYNAEMTKLCSDRGKLFKHWLENRNSREMMSYCENILNQSQAREIISPKNLALGDPSAGIPADACGHQTSQSEIDVKISPIPVSITITGTDNGNIRGTYVCSKLIPHIASWVSAEFGIRVGCIVEDFVIRDCQYKLKMMTNTCMCRTCTILKCHTNTYLIF